MKPQRFASTFVCYRQFFPMVGCLLLAVGLGVGCKPKPASTSLEKPANVANYFHTSFQNECEFIVQAIVSDVAEQMYYAAKHKLPDEKSFSVAAREKPGSPLDEPVYELQIHLEPKQPELKCEVTINGPIWSPQVYHNVALRLAKAVNLSPLNSKPKGDTSLLEKLKDGTPETIEKENQRLSADLESDFGNPELHEQAAVLLGAFMLRDHSGKFHELRSPLSRLTAHLTMAAFLRGSRPAGINGRMAEAMMLTLVGDEADAVKQLDEIGAGSAAVLPFVRALLARNTGDYRPLEKQDGLSDVESLEWFLARVNNVRTGLVWPKLSDTQKLTVDYVRVANEAGYSVETGHQLLAVSIPLEMRELRSVYTLSHKDKLSKENLVPALNELPDGCFKHSGGKVDVRVIGWGQWANFLQRHLCHAVQQNYYFMKHMWGVYDDAKEFAAQCDESFGGLRLYPFVRRFNASDAAAYRKAVDDGFKVTVATPQLVPAECWNYLCNRVSFAPLYKPVLNPHIKEWYNHNPPPGTVYEIEPRLDQRSLVDRLDTAARIEELHRMAPHDCRIIHFMLTHQYHSRATYDQAAALFQAVLPYSIDAMRSVAQTVYDQPAQYEKLLQQAAAVDPTCYYDLGRYEYMRKNDDEAAKYLDLVCDTDPDRVRAASRAYWRVQYYLKKGQIEKARQIADEGGEVYSEAGLEAKASFLEGTTNYVGAFEWYAKIDERYDSWGPLVLFCTRYKDRTGDNRFDAELQKKVEKVFPGGKEKVSLASFHGAPTDGVVIQEQSDLLTAAGLRAGDVIVALNGTRTHSIFQYDYLRTLLTGPELDLIVWQSGAYKEVKTSPPRHLFGASFANYRSR